MTFAARFLDQLASLTAIRSIELIECSLLKTLRDLLEPRSLSLVRLNSKGQPIAEVVCEGDECAVREEGIELSEPFLRADEFLAATNAQQFSSAVEPGVFLVYPLMSSRLGRNLVQMVLARELSALESQTIAGVLQIYRNFVGLMQHAQTDQLTGLANRKTFDECVTRVHDLIPPKGEVPANDRRESKAHSYWLVMVDIDHFKSVNDRFGHLFGDEVLVLMAQLMQASFRETDLIFRFGGEEFVLILRCADRAGCFTTLERFRRAAAERPIPQVGHVTVSMGATRMDRETFPATMLDHADQAVYHSKGNGRNQVTFFEDLVEKGLVVINEIQTDEISYF